MLLRIERLATRRSVFHEALRFAGFLFLVGCLIAALVIS